MSETNIPNLQLCSLGGAGTVTGSKHFLKTPDFNVLVDCGLFQGLKVLREQNWLPLHVDIKQINAVILTHAHLDHCGYLPLLVKQGYRGPVYLSKPTADLTELILRDSASLQEEDAARANRKGYSRHHPAKPLYDTSDVERTLNLFKTVETNSICQLGSEFSFRLFPVGHILGACYVQFDYRGKRIIFSGDIGRRQSQLLPPPQLPGGADVLVMEATYGDRLHLNEDPELGLQKIIMDTIARHGKVLIPCFAVGRAQEIIRLLDQLKSKKLIPGGLPVYLDSPMATAADRITRKHADWLKITTEEIERMFSGVKICREVADSKKVVRSKEPKIVLAASGMLTGGRVLHYLTTYLNDKRNTILLPGFQAEGTRGRALLNGAQEIKAFGKYWPVHCQVLVMDTFSGHADQGELLDWASPAVTANTQIYLVHGEPGALDALRTKLHDNLHVPVHIMQQDVSVTL